MTEKLQQTIKKELEKLPKENQEAINSIDWVKIAEEIGRKYMLLEEEINSLQVEILLILTGLEEFDSYIRNIENEIGLSKDEAEKISIEITQKIFNPIAEKIPKKESGLSKESIEEKLDERFDNLSEEIKKIIIETNYHVRLFAIAEENKLTVPQMGILEETTTKVITGSVHPDEFEKILIKNLGLPEGIVRKIANKINEEILKIIRGKMEEVYKKPKSINYDIKPVKTKNETSTSGQIGIKIIKPNLNLLELNSGEKKGEQILAQKLSTPSKTSTVKTDHSLSNLQPSSIKKENIKAYPPKGDPYRLSPDE